MLERLKQYRHADAYRHLTRQVGLTVSLACGVLKQVQHDIFTYAERRRWVMLERLKKDRHADAYRQLTGQVKHSAWLSVWGAETSSA